MRIKYNKKFCIEPSDMNFVVEVLDESENETSLPDEKGVFIKIVFSI